MASWSRRPPAAPRSGIEPYRHPKPVYRNAVKCTIYLIYVLDPRTNFTTLTLGYVGETRLGRETTRFLEHVGDGTARKPGQPWADTIPEHDPDRAAAAGVWKVLGAQYDPDQRLWVVDRNAVYSCKEDVRVAEEATVVRLRPLYNDEYNHHNPDRITIPDARRARAERDRRNGVPAAESWATLHAQYTAQRASEPRDQFTPARAGQPRLSLPTVRLSRVARRRLAVLSGWLAVSLVLWWLAARYVHIVGVLRLGAASGVATALAMAWWTRPSRRDPWRRFCNGLLRAVLVATLLYFLLGPAVMGLVAHARMHTRR